MHLKTPRAKVPYASARGLCFGANGKEEDPLPKTPIDSQIMRRRRCAALWSSKLMARDLLLDGARCQAVEQTGSAAQRSAPPRNAREARKMWPRKNEGSQTAGCARGERVQRASPPRSQSAERPVSQRIAARRFTMDCAEGAVLRLACPERLSKAKRKNMGPEKRWACWRSLPRQVTETHRGQRELASTRSEECAEVSSLKDRIAYIRNRGAPECGAPHRSSLSPRLPRWRQ